MKCYNCGATLRENDYYCPNCRQLNQPKRGQGKGGAAKGAKGANRAKSSKGAKSARRDGLSRDRIVNQLRSHWVSCLIAIGIAVLFFFDWFSVSFFIIALSGHITAIYDEVRTVMDMLGMEIAWFSAVFWATRAYYLIPAAQVVYLVSVFIGPRFAVRAGMVAAWLTFGMTVIYLALYTYIGGRLGGGILGLKSAPVCLLILSLVNGILMIWQVRRSRRKQHV